MCWGSGGYTPQWILDPEKAINIEGNHVYDTWISAAYKASNQANDSEVAINNPFREENYLLDPSASDYIGTAAGAYGLSRGIDDFNDFRTLLGNFSDLTAGASSLAAQYVRNSVDDTGFPGISELFDRTAASLETEVEAIRDRGKTGVSEVLGNTVIDEGGTIDIPANALTDVESVISGLKTTVEDAVGDAYAEAAVNVTTLDIETKTTSASTAAGSLSNSAFPTLYQDTETATGSAFNELDSNTQSYLVAQLSLALDDILNGTHSLSTVITQAISSAATAVDSSTITDMVTAFENDLLPEHMRSVNRLTGGVVEAGAENSSAFLLSMTLLESGYTDKVARFRSDLKLKTYLDVIAQFMDAFKSNLALYMSTYLEDMKTQTALYANLLDVNGKLFLTHFTQYVDMYMKEFLTHIDLEKTLLVTGTSSSEGFTGSYLKLYDSLVGGEVQGYTRSKIERGAASNSFMNNFMGNYFAASKTQMGTNAVFANLLQSYDKMRYDLDVTMSKGKAGFEATRKMWVTENWIKAASIIGTGAGSVPASYVPPMGLQTLDAVSDLIGNVASVMSEIPGLGG